MGRPWWRSPTEAGPAAALPHRRLQVLRRIVACRCSDASSPAGSPAGLYPAAGGGEGIRRILTCRCSGEPLTGGRWRRRAPPHPLLQVLWRADRRRSSYSELPGGGSHWRRPTGMQGRWRWGAAGRADAGEGRGSCAGPVISFKF
jgi:hypothetical protein